MCGNSRKTIIISLLVLELLFAMTAGTAAESLWTSQGGGLFVDHKAARVGDLITILIVEQSQASQNASTQTSKEGSVSAGPGLGILKDVLPEIGGSGGDSLSATGKTSRGGSLRAKVTVQVAEVFSNGNLFLRGNQLIMINGEEQQIEVSGIVRPQDVQGDNTVLSTFVADARITYLGEGPVGERQKPGIITKIFNWLF